MMAETFIIGILIAFLVYEYAGLSAGGIVTLAYFTLMYQKPLVIINCLAVAVVVWLVMDFILRRTVLYGRSRFLITVAIGFLLRVLIDSAIYGAVLAHNGPVLFGYVIPGLVANDMLSQKPLPTLAALAGSLTVALLLAYGLAFVGVVK